MSDKFLPIYNQSNYMMLTNTGKDYQWKTPTSSMWSTSHKALNLNALPSTWIELVAKVKVNTNVRYYDYSVRDYVTIAVNRAFLIHILKDEIESSYDQPSNSFSVGSSRVVPSTTSGIEVQNYDYDITLYVTPDTVSIINQYYCGVYIHGSQVTDGVSMDIVYR